MPAARGFTLVELLIVLAIMGLLVGLVGGVGVERLEKARAQEEWLVLERLVRGLSFRAFAGGREIEITGDGAQLVWRIGAEPAHGRALERWFVAPAQRIVIDAHGIAQPAQLTLVRGQLSRAIELNGWLDERAGAGRVSGASGEVRP